MAELREILIARGVYERKSIIIGRMNYVYNFISKLSSFINH